MKLEIIEKAVYYFYGGFVNVEKETKEKIFFEVDGDKVHYVKGMGYTFIHCTCRHCSIKSKYKPICGRQIACLLYLASKERQRQLKRGK